MTWSSLAWSIGRSVPSGESTGDWLTSTWLFSWIEIVSSAGMDSLGVPGPGSIKPRYFSSCLICEEEMKYRSSRKTQSIIGPIWMVTLSSDS